MSSPLNIQKESLKAIGNLDVINPLKYNSIYSCDLVSKDTFSQLMNDLEFETVLIEVMATPSFIEEWKKKVEKKMIHMNTVSKKFIHIECVLTKEELMADYLLDELYFLASINDFVVIIANPANNKSYMNLNTQKVDVTTENNEKIIWFEYDAADLYIID
ncbi:hypothetical protein H2N74_19005 [Bacillus velezensis]|uniref:hypothetical protein n=1 Tax=Bacillus TaxID=1386 RepID=UPI0009CACBAE|nr:MULTISPECIES: hypothetical protein [Bacillus]SLA99987.1 Uncharacterised protein [Mycobacteroides abscessus subsp. massiliense]ATY30229.1 hypothetical protein CVD07_18820 [Bacillus velezensis]MBL3627677.1 hypothetical protein [Bacillus sp. RHF6]MBU0445397.1 hypothetical protein [Bacillus amyloliquefaciens]MCY9465699.1 hypothetical protein [Bacillus velezensis]